MAFALHLLQSALLTLPCPVILPVTRQRRSVRCCSLVGPDVLVYSRPPSLPRVLAPPSQGPVLILPGFGNDCGDYEAPFGQADASLVAALRARGFNASVLPVQRSDWFRVAAALFSLNFYSSTCTVADGYAWYLQRVSTAVQELHSATGLPVTLVGHSAGGWLARAFLAAPGPRPPVSALVSLGTPHAPPPAAADPTRGALKWLSQTSPGAFHAQEGVRYVSVMSRTVRGRSLPAGSKAERTPASYAAASYCTLLEGGGEGVWGDAVVPLDCALLPGSESVVFEGVWHSMSRVGTFDEDSGLVWYGSESVVDAWLSPMVAEETREEGTEVETLFV